MSINTKNSYDIIIIGGGASGLFFCANEENKQKKLILEGSGTLGTKILLAGGGRCNYSNLNANPTSYVGQNTKMLPSFFHKFGVNEMISWREKRGITSKEEDNGRIFPQSNNAKTLLNCLINEAKKNNTTLLTNQKVKEIKNIEQGFEIYTQDKKFYSKKVIITTGGKTFPKTGTTGFAYEIANKFGLETTKNYYQTLCGINTQEDFSSLSGYTTPAKITLYHNNKALHQEERNLLFTHRGVSGPAIFNISLYLGNYCQKKDISIENISTSKFSLEIQCKEISKRLKKFIEEQEGTLSTSPLTKENTPNFSSPFAKGGLRGILTATPKSFRSRNEAKVTGGGILMKELKQNFESKKIPGLYFLGECLDITGQTGGYNLQRCRTSAWICAKSVNI